MRHAELELQEVFDPAQWDDCLAYESWASFQQSWVWGEFQKSQGHTVRRFLLKDGKQTLLAAQLIRQDRFLSGYWFAPRGPVLVATTEPQDRREIMFVFLQKLVAQRLTGPSLFYRFEPPIRAQSDERIMPLRLRRMHPMSPASTILLDLQLSEEDLLTAMHSKTRYNIRVAEKHGVRVELVGQDKLESFFSLLRDTAERDEFDPHPERYLRAMYEFLVHHEMIRLRVAKQGERVLAANIEIAFGDTVTYLHGASSSASRALMAPYALHWAAIQEAKAQGFHYYDFWGCNPASKASYYYKPSWEGITRFKQSWGGAQVDLIGTWDLPINQLLYRLVFYRELWRG